MGNAVALSRGCPRGPQGAGRSAGLVHTSTARPGENRVGAGVRVGGLLSDLFGANGRRILDGLAAGRSREDILASLSRHVRHRLADLCDALEVNLSAQARFILMDQLDAFDQAGGRIAAYDAFIHERLAAYRDRIDLLTTLPGVDDASARAIFIELGPNIGVFPTARHCAAWAGLCPGNSESAGKRRAGRTRKGNTFLRSLLVECAHGAARTAHCQFKGYHKALTVLRCIHAMLSTGSVYRDPETDYEALMVKRNAPWWIAMLKKHRIDPATWKAKEPAAA